MTKSLSSDLNTGKLACVMLLAGRTDCTGPLNVLRANPTGLRPPSLKIRKDVSRQETGTSAGSRTS